ncbi:type II toxin-antitoxin system HicA family toxin [Thiobacillus sp.]|uniref:type II toxin-antitoxin system HicA family toxin n=1 Tax=Thiobacillus sp. TaxID=924 RepID=UPI003418A36E
MSEIPRSVHHAPLSFQWLGDDSNWAWRRQKARLDPKSLCREIWFCPATHRYTIIPNHPGDMPEGTLRAILKQTGVEVEAFLGK